MLVKNPKEWARVVCERDNYVCQICKHDYNYPIYFLNGVNQYVCGHHCKTKGSHPELKLETDNGLTVCSICHEAIHKGKIPKYTVELRLEEAINKN